MERQMRTVPARTAQGVAQTPTSEEVVVHDRLAQRTSSQAGRAVETVINADDALVAVRAVTGGETHELCAPDHGLNRGFQVDGIEVASRGREIAQVKNPRTGDTRHAHLYLSHFRMSGTEVLYTLY